jgi:uncharacterized membrane-anchored protein YhcB (DUF1043 family)
MTTVEAIVYLLRDTAFQCLIGLVIGITLGAIAAKFYY